MPIYYRSEFVYCLTGFNAASKNTPYGLPYALAKVEANKSATLFLYSGLILATISNALISA